MRRCPTKVLFIGQLTNKSGECSVCDGVAWTGYWIGVVAIILPFASSIVTHSAKTGPDAMEQKTGNKWIEHAEATNKKGKNMAIDHKSRPVSASMLRINIV